MKRIFYALIALCAFMVVLPSCGNPNTPSNQGGNGGVNGKGKEFEVKGVTFKMIEVKGGTFTMGSLPNDESAYSNEWPAHSVTVSDFYIGETEVTQELWAAVMGISFEEKMEQWIWYPHGIGDKHPLYDISWDECQIFIQELNQISGMHFRLPTEAEWEYAACGGTRSKGYLYGESDYLSDFAWYIDNSNMETHPVSSLQPNELGLYDMIGNVQEWCSDWYEEYDSSSQVNPQGPTSGTTHVVRGSCWYYPPRSCRPKFREDFDPDFMSDCVGFRLVLDK